MNRALRSLVLSVVIAATAGPLAAVAQNLPQTPNATAKEGDNGMTAGASVQREGGSALEPYLVTWLIPAFGIIIYGFGVWTDKRLRKAV